jgi:predicted metal-binding membrane protein
LTGEGGLSFTLKRDRAVVLAALLVLSALAGGYTAWLAVQMAASPADMPGMDMRGAGLMASAFIRWTPAHLVFMFSMWAVMMVGMMTPSAAPIALIYMQVARRSTAGAAFASAGWLVGGYLLAWSLFAAVATLAQWGLESWALIAPTMAAGNRRFAGGLLLAAGVYQWMPIRDACLSQCRAPLSFVQRHGGFRANASGSLRLGFLHGLYCIGCCWALMLLLFVGGVMNLLWIAALMIFVLAEKLVPSGHFLSRVAGLIAIALGIWMSTRAPAQLGPIG